MKLVSYRSAGAWRSGVLQDNVVFDVSLALESANLKDLGATPTVRELLRLHGDDLSSISSAIGAVADLSAALVGPLAELTIGPPVPDPDKVLCIGLNYADHVAETGRSLPKYPDVFAKFAGSLIGPNDPIGGLSVTEQLDFEGELAIVIGKEARDVAPEDARRVIAGVMILNDITARDLQYRGTQWLMGKAVDASTPTGPALVTIDEIPDLQDLSISTHVNGARMQNSNTRHMIFPIADIIAYLSRTITLLPGDIIATGTPDGIGAKRTPPVWLSQGDIVDVYVEGIGTLSNVVGG